MLNWLFGSNTSGADIYVDLGTANTLIVARGQGLILNEPSEVMVSDIDPKKRKVLGLGLDGREILKKNPGHIAVIKPIRDGVIADFDATRVMLKTFLTKSIQKINVSRPKVVVSLPYGITDVEKKAVLEACRSAGASKTYLIDEPMAAALGAGLSIKGATGQMIIDIGGGSTEIAVIALADIVYCEPLKLGGHKFDEVIVRYLKETKKLIVTESQAEFLKLKFVVFLGCKDDGIFAGSRVSSAGDELWEHAAVEASRNYKNSGFYAKYPEKIDYKSTFVTRLLYFSKNKNEALKQIAATVNNNWPKPELLVLKQLDTGFNSIFVWRCLFKDYIGWHVGDEKKFVY